LRAANASTNVAPTQDHSSDPQKGSTNKQVISVPGLVDYLNVLVVVGVGGYCVPPI